ncbi:Myrosinase 1 [Eumeta japonica]|uniref:Myrosinase 1 n=1 Tax=Eumeta variegata TaxID=151549 RepID=A0A4C1WSB5_EUMVA|nr:Myrosinase 1 [Eumeta japonica]
MQQFPPEFLFGISSSAYQIEGAWDVDDKSPSIWDVSTHADPCWIPDCSNGDVATNSYRLYERDIEMVGELGVDFYRFSLSWPRLIPEGLFRKGKHSVQGVAYYRKVIESLRNRGIEPLVTMFHWDLPQRLQDLGGWMNPLVVDWYADYAKLVFEVFGDQVKYWITINEPYIFCWFSYGTKILAPRLDSAGVGVYLCVKHVLLAHAKAYHIYNEEFRASQNGIVGISNALYWYEAATDSDEDKQAVADMLEFECGLYLNPIFSEEGDFPDLVKRRVAEKSAEQGFPRSRLPQFTAEQVNYLRGSFDFLGINHYSTYLAYRNYSEDYTNNFGYSYSGIPSLPDDISVHLKLHPDRPTSISSVQYAPEGLEALLAYIREKYNNPPVFITENGWPDRGGLEDDDRSAYIKGYVQAVRNAIDEGSNMLGYSAWSLMDSFEWNSGYTAKYGLYEVDFESEELTRTPRKSAFVYREITRSRAVDPAYEPPADRHAHDL